MNKMLAPILFDQSSQCLNEKFTGITMNLYSNLSFQQTSSTDSPVFNMLL